jgi:polysaccharide biosynthesis transport protein
MKFSLVFFVRLLLRHIFLILSVPIVLAVTVFLFTRDEPLTYKSQTTVFTSLASGNSVDLTGFTFNTVTTQFDNLMGIIKSNSTLEETGLSLFASHLMLEKADPVIIQQNHYEEIMKNVPADVKKLKVHGDFEKTLAGLRQYMKSSNDNFVYNLIHIKTTYYNPGTISGKLSVKRLQNSDNIELSYESDDAGICQQTLVYLVKAYKQAYIVQKAGQSENAVAYFENEVNKAAERLKAAEDELLEFNKSNKIINYNEQSKFIAGRKEQFEMGYQEVLKQNSASKAVIDLLEKKMAPEIKRRLSSSELLSLRSELSKVNERLAAIQPITDAGEKTPVELTKYKALTQKSSELKQRMRTVVDSLYQQTRGLSNVPEKTVVTDWLSSVIEFEGTNAQIVTLNGLREEFNVIYSQYAPMGAMMRRLERKINVAEDEYMSLVKNLGLAKLKQQSVEVSSANTILDPPNYPTHPQPDKRKMLIIAAAFVGLLITLFTILAFDLMDSSLRNAAKATSETGLEVESIFPVISKRRKKKIDIDYIEKKSIDAITRKLILHSLTLQKEKGPVICIAFSTLENEGKSFLMQRIAADLSSIGHKVLLLYPHEAPKADNTDFDIAQYLVSRDFYRISSFRSLETPYLVPDWENYSFIFVEFPGILHSSFPVNLFKSADNCFLVCRANRSWSKADANILAEVLAVTDPVKPRILLNGVALEEMESLVGELPKKRSWIRLKMKQILTSQFSDKPLS